MFNLSPLPRTLAAALRDVRDKKVLVRASAVRDLARLAREDEREPALAALSAALCDDAAPGVRAEACVALADAEAHESLAALVTAARADAALRVRQMAVLALGELATSRDRAACEVIESALYDAEPELRFQALIAVARILGRGSKDAIHRAMSDEHAHVRYMAFRLAEEHWVEKSAGEAVPEELFEAARAALADEAVEVRLAAAILLAHAGDESGASVLVCAVNAAGGEIEPEDQQAAIDLSGRLGLEGARPGLERRAFGLLGIASDQFSWQARVALARLGDERARRAILRGLSSWSRDARTLAVAAAGQAALSDALPALRAMRGHPERADPQAVEEALQLLDET